MARSSDDYAAAAHKGRLSHHKWQAPPPGSGRLDVCSVCGAKRTADAINSGCEDTAHDEPRETRHDYAPY